MNSLGYGFCRSQHCVGGVQTGQRCMGHIWQFKSSEQKQDTPQQLFNQIVQWYGHGIEMPCMAYCMVQKNYGIATPVVEPTYITAWQTPVIRYCDRFVACSSAASFNNDICRSCNELRGSRKPLQNPMLWFQPMIAGDLCMPPTGVTHWNQQRTSGLTLQAPTKPQARLQPQHFSQLQSHFLAPHSLQYSGARPRPQQHAMNADTSPFISALACDATLCAAAAVIIFYVTH